MGKIIDLTGHTFGRLTVIKRADDYISPKGKHVARWLCECSCDEHNNVIVQTSGLTKGGTKSCGCLAKEMASKINKKYNTYDLSGDYGIGYTLKGEEFYFDLEDYELIKNYCWHINKCGYVVSFAPNKKYIMLHRIVMNCPECLYVDHIHGKDTKHDNRKFNLRIATPSQNQMNVGLKSTNKSGITGVIWDKNRNKWMAHIQAYGEHCAKRFDNFEDAVAQRKNWEKEYFGEYSYESSSN